MSDEEMIDYIAKLFNTFDVILLYNSNNFPMAKYDFIRQKLTHGAKAPLVSWYISSCSLLRRYSMIHYKN